MFSEIQRNYIEQMVKTNYKDYPYYIAYTNTNISNQVIQDNYNFILILSKDKITANSKYSYTFENYNNTICLSVRSGGASYNYHNERVVNTPLSSNNLNINNYEFVYTNAVFETVSLQPNIIQTNELTENTFNGVMVALFIVILSITFFRFLGGR